MLETNHTVSECEKGIVLTATYVLSGMDMSSALSDKDIAGDYALAVCLLRTKTLGLGVTAVLGGADALLMSKELKIQLQHRFLPPLLMCVRSILDLVYVEIVIVVLKHIHKLQEVCLNESRDRKLLFLVLAVFGKSTECLYLDISGVLIDGVFNA